MKLVRLFFLLAVLPVFFCISSPALTIAWTNTSGGNWNVAANWNPNQVPSASDDAIITNAGTYTVTLNTASTISGLTLGGSSGTQTLATSSTFILNGAGFVNPNGILSHSAGTQGGTGTLSVDGALNWSGGTLNRSGVTTIAPGASLTLSGTTKLLSGATLVNGGTGTWSAGGLNSGDGSVFSNAPSGSFTVTFDVTTGNLGAPRTIANAGQFNANPGTGNTLQFGEVFNNFATVNVQSGTLNLSGGGTHAATANFVVSPGATLDLGAGTHNFNAASSVSGAGNFEVSGGTANLNGSLNVGGTNAFTGGTANFLGNYTINGNPVIISGGTANFSTSGTIAPGSLSLSAGTLGCSNSVTVNGPMIWTGGIISGNNTLRANGGLAMSGTTKVLNGATIINAGTATWSAGGLNSGNGSVFSNAPSGSLTVTFGVTTGNLGAPRTIANAGQFNANPGTGNTLQFGEVFNNFATVNVQSGTLNLSGGGTHAATANFVVSPGATLDLGAGTHNFNAASSVSGAGNFEVSGGTANLNGSFNVGGTNAFTGGTANFLGNYTINGNPVIISGGTANFSTSGTIAPGSLSLSAGTLGCSNSVTVNGPMIWTGGIISGNNTLRASGGLTMSGTTKVLNGATIINAGTATWSAGGFNTGNGSVFSNAPSGSFTVTFDVTTGNLGAPRTIANAGQFNANPGTGNTLQFGEVFNNFATVNVQSGTLNLSGGGTHSATANFVVSPGATLDLGAGTHNFNAASSVSGAGNFEVSGGTAILNGSLNVGGTNVFSGGTANFLGNYTINGNPVIVSGGTANFSTSGTIAPGSLSLSAGTLGCSNSVTVNGPMIWTGGTVSGNNTLRANGGLTMSGNTKVLNGATLVNSGTATWSAGGLNSGDGSVFSNAPSGIFTVTFDVTTGNLGGSRTIANAGEFNVGPGAGNSVAFGELFLNSGSVNVESGSLNLVGIFSQTAGLTLLGGGNITNTVPLRILGGALSGTGVISGSVTNAGLVSPGASPGQLIVVGTFTQTGAGTLNIELAGIVPGTGYDQLVISGSANLAGALVASLTNGFYPSPGFVFTNVVRAATRNGTFAAFNYPSNVIGLQINYGTTNVALQVINTLPILPNIGNQVVDELTLLGFSVGATDNDLPAQTLSYALSNSPPNANLDSAGLLSWTPAENQGPSTTNITVVITDNGTPPLTTNQTFQVTVNEVNVAPAIAPPPDVAFNELTGYSNNASATDTDFPVNPLVFSLISGPSNLNVSASGVIAWTPSEAQGPSTNIVLIRVADTNPPAINTTSLSSTGSFTLIVREVNVAPVLAAINNLTVNPGQTVSFTAVGTDTDVPTNVLRFDLIGAPTGASVGNSSGSFNWRPTVAQASSSNFIQLRVTDTNPPAVNATTLSDTKGFTVFVNGLSPVLLTAPSYSNGEFQFQVSGTPGPDYVIMAGTTPTSFTDLITNLSASPPFQFTNAIGSATNLFYRVRLQP